ncbi:interleukin-1 receptor type 1-like isoform X2 [Conger conger]|uniref:interleukin-1 receptor type 1-like isoform X2 n=1 Tax=Conger conger TaxID=82655 RepID=UPI002A5B0C27|nr:interleukin-1 receptor type 1-like isoform X2 [Conger conger]
MLLILLASAACFHGVSAGYGQRSTLARQQFTKPLQEHCKDYETQFEIVFTVPGDAAVLNCTLASPDVFDLHSTPYNISWYDCKAGRELSEDLGQFQVRGTMLWFLNSTLEDAGHYQCILRTPNGCFKQKSVLRVDTVKAGSCGRPDTSRQMLTTQTNSFLVCPLLEYISQADSYSIQWYKDCERLLEGDKFSHVGGHRLLVRHVVVSDSGLYTCRVTFNLTGTIGYAAETIECDIKENGVKNKKTSSEQQFCGQKRVVNEREQWSLRPIVYQPVNEMVKAEYGGHFNKTCRVFVPSKGNLSVDIYWASEFEFISTNLSDRVHQLHLSEENVDDGVLLEVLLNFTNVKEEDFNQNYTCMIFSDKGVVTSDFILQPSDRNGIIHPVLLFVSLAVTFLISVTAYKIFKIDIVLWCRRSFPYLYTRTGSDGKVYDAYVVYPRMCWNGFHGSAETFVIHTLPQVLEKKCGYKLFIYCRDSLPGEAVVDSVQENISKSRRLILLYTGSMFSELASTLRFEQEIGMHTALVEGTVQVILVELEEVTDYSLFPQSVLHLKRKQGAIQWWKAANKATGHSQLCPSSRFWKQVQYQMPVKSSHASSLQ